MKLSTRGRYGLRACFALASAENDEVVSLSTLSKQTGVSEKYLEQLLSMLRKGGIISTQRGAGGGYYLAQDPSKISVGKILDAVDELHISECDSGCTDNYCPNRTIFMRLQDSISNLLNGISLLDFVNEHKCTARSDGNEGIS